MVKRDAQHSSDARVKAAALDEEPPGTGEQADGFGNERERRRGG